MGNTITNRRKSRNATVNSYAPSLFNKPTLERERKGNKQRYDLRSKTLPARNRKRNDLEKANNNNNVAQTLPNHRTHYNEGVVGAIDGRTTPPTPPPPNGETSRVLFLLYLIHRTWNVITDTKSKSSSQGKVSEKPSNRDSFYETESNCSLSLSDLYDAGAAADDSQCCSQYSLCSCSSCYNDAGAVDMMGGQVVEQNVYNSIDEQFSQDSIADDGKAVSLCKR